MKNALTSSQLNGFFRHLSEKLPFPIKIFLTGGAEALLIGSSRPTKDIDFGVQISFEKGGGETRWRLTEEAILEASADRKMMVQYSQEIDRWSSIAIPGYRRRARRFARFGKLDLMLLDPTDWAVPKLTRYLDSDIFDLISVLKKQKIPPQDLAKRCGNALKKSPRSSALFLFRRQVEHFFMEHGKQIWGKGFHPEASLKLFHQMAGMKGKRSRKRPDRSNSIRKQDR